MNEFDKHDLEFVWNFDIKENAEFPFSILIFFEYYAGRWRGRIRTNGDQCGHFTGNAAKNSGFRNS